MANDKKSSSANRKTGNFQIEGRVQREQADCESGELKISVYAFDKAGTSLGRAAVDDKGNYSMAVHMTRPADVTVLIGPTGDAQQIRHSWSLQFRRNRCEFESSLGRLHGTIRRTRQQLPQTRQHAP